MCVDAWRKETGRYMKRIIIVDAVRVHVVAGSEYKAWVK